MGALYPPFWCNNEYNTAAGHTSVQVWQKGVENQHDTNAVEHHEPVWQTSEHKYDNQAEVHSVYINETFVIMASSNTVPVNEQDGRA
jgi:hypothetical protein